MKPFTAVLVGLALAMTASPAAASFAPGKELTFASVVLLEPTGTDSCDDDGVLDSGETARVRVTLLNSGTEPLAQTNMTLSSADPDVSFPGGQKVSFPASEPLQRVTAELPVKLLGPRTRRAITLHIDYGDDAPELGYTRRTVEYGVNTDEVPATSTIETVETPQHPWTLTASPASLTPWTRWFDSTSTSAFFRGPNNTAAGSLMLVSPPLQVSKTVPFRVIFQQRYVFESVAGSYYDGAVVELSEDEVKWGDLGPFLSPTYNATLAAGGTNPLQGKPVYGGQSLGYPAFLQTTANLGTTYAGKTVRIRFRIGTDDSKGATGWDLDDLQFEGVENKPFTSLVDDRGVCVNHAPVAAVKPVEAVDEGTNVTLEGSATDVDGDTAFVYTWTQVGGPTVPLSDSASATPTFTAPQVNSNRELTFQLVVSDGKLQSAPVTVRVLVRNVLPLVAQAGEDQSISEGSGVTLNGSDSTGPKDAVLSYTWTQVDGPTVNLMLAGPRAMFNAPAVDEDTDLTFRLQVTDGRGMSGEDTVTVRVTDKPPAAPPDAGCGATGQGGGVPTAALLLLAAFLGSLASRRRL